MDGQKIATIAPEAVEQLKSTALCVLLEIEKQLAGRSFARIDYDVIAGRLDVSRQTVSNTVDVLIRRGLLRASKAGLSIAPGVIVYIPPFGGEAVI